MSSHPTPNTNTNKGDSYLLTFCYLFTFWGLQGPLLGDNYFFDDDRAQDTGDTCGQLLFLCG